MLLPIKRMKVEESAIPLHKLYNKLVNGVKKEHEKRNLHLKSVYKPEEPP